MIVKKGGDKNLILQERDFLILKEIERWRWLLGRHIQELCYFSSARTTDRRLKILVESGYLERKKILYGVPNIYFLTNKGKKLLGASRHMDSIRIELIRHDIIVVDMAIYLSKTMKISYDMFITEKELHRKDGFGNRNHAPDFCIKNGESNIAVEIELSLKSKERLEKNIQLNFLNYDKQFWIIEKSNAKLYRNLEEIAIGYGNIEIRHLEDAK